MEEALLALLLGAPAVSAIVGERVDWGARPQGDPYPGVVLTLPSDVGGHTVEGPDGTSRALVQVDCWATTYLGARDLGRAVRAVLDGHRGGLIMGVLLAGARDGREGGSNEADRPFRSSQDFRVHYRTS